MNVSSPSGNEKMFSSKSLWSPISYILHGDMLWSNKCWNVSWSVWRYILFPDCRQKVHRSMFKIKKRILSVMTVSKQLSQHPYKWTKNLFLFNWFDCNQKLRMRGIRKGKDCLWTPNISLREKSQWSSLEFLLKVALQLSLHSIIVHDTPRFSKN